MKNKNTVIFIVTILLSFPILCFGWSLYGPFENVRKAWICTALSTADHKYLATSFFPNALINEYKDKYFNTVPNLPEQQKDSVVVINSSHNIFVEDVSVGLSNGKLMTVENPADIDVAVCDYLCTSGLQLNNLIIQENAVGGINAGAYIEKDGSSHGSVPGGIIIKDGEITYLEEGKNDFCLIGFDYSNILRIGYVSSEEQIKSYNLRCGISFGPPLIMNGKGLIEETGMSLQPRTAIAQKSDGSVLLLVLDGRQVSSAGATIKNVQDLLLEKGAVNAANLDGGSSSTMEYKGELLNKPSDRGIEKQIPTAFIIKKHEGKME